MGNVFLVWFCNTKASALPPLNPKFHLTSGFFHPIVAESAAPNASNKIVGSLLESFAFKANLTYTHGGSVDSHHPLPSISPLFGHLTLRYIVGKSSDFEFSYRFSSSKNPDKYSIGGEDGLEETPVIFDGRNQYNAFNIEKDGFEYFQIGKTSF